jgi:anhydro-N-acetylmuramic acid kinase
MKLFIGLMSGTSMDGIDAALVDMETNKLIAGLTRPYGEKAKQFLHEVLAKETISPARLFQLNTIIGQEFAFATQELLKISSTSPKDIIAIGSHGQTICHDAIADIPYTIQLGCGHTIAEFTGIKVVADFRTRDLVIGGQGAPFAPIYHQALFAKEGLPLAVINIGGIANVTYLAPNNKVNGHDIGPGNCLMDAWIQTHLGRAYDKNGEWASTGKVISNLLQALLNDAYFKRQAPKSLGKEYFSSMWLEKHLQPHYAPNDVQATLLALTATTIADEIKQSPFKSNHVVLCGGGTHNILLQETLKQQLPNVDVNSTQIYGVDPDFLEAMMFAWFADKALSETPLDLTQITGAKKAAILGVIYPMVSI